MLSYILNYHKKILDDFLYSKGSVIAKIKLVFNPEFVNDDNETRLADAVKKGKVGALEVDKESFKIVGEQCV